jgi:hypothetical protein
MSYDEQPARWAAVPANQELQNSGGAVLSPWAEGPGLANRLVRPRNAADLRSDSGAMPADLLPPLGPPDPDDPELEEHVALISALIKIFELDQETPRVTDDGRVHRD